MGDRRSAAGLTTVVFVDVEESTALLDRVGDQAGLASVGDQLDRVRERVEEYGGRVVKGTGDGFLLTFGSPRQAVSFAVASQRAAAGTAPRICFGINTGEVVDADADPLGGAVNAAFRIAGRATGGEVLVSDVVRQLVGTVPAIRFVDRGRCRLKGFSDRWHLWAAEQATGEPHAAVTIGRAAELAAVGDLVSSTAAGVGRVVLLEGEAGFGKTHLVRDATARARQAGMGVVEVASDELVRRPGFVAHGLLDAHPAQPARDRLHGLLGGATGQATRGEDLSYAVIEASVDLLEEMARAQPVLVAAEDLHWADDLSLGVLAAIIQRAGASRFAVIGSMRPSPRPAALDRLVERVLGGVGIHLRLDTLDDVDVHALASALTGAAPGTSLRERLRSTAGNPFYVTELLRSLDDDGLVRIADGVADVTPGVPPVSLNETLVRRLSWLPPDTKELLRLASLLGNTFILRDLAAITGRAVVDVATWLREASLAGLIVGEADRLAFRHELIREAVYAHMLPAERHDLHHAAGQALAQVGAPTHQIAEQFARSAPPGDVDAITWLIRAADETISVSPADAVALLDRAVSLTTPQWPGRATLRARMIEPLTWCGRYDDAEALADTVLASSPDADAEYHALRGLAAVHGGRGDIATSIATLHRAAAAPAAPADEARLQRSLAAYLSALVIGSSSVPQARQLADAALAEAIAAGDAQTECLAHQAIGVLEASSGHTVAGMRHWTEATALLETGRVPPASYLIPDIFSAFGLLELDEVEEASAAAAHARRLSEHRGARGRLPMAYVAAATVCFYAGRWDDARAELEAGLALIEDTGNLNYVLYYEALLATIATHRGDLATAQSQLASGLRRVTDGHSRLGTDWLFGAQAEFLAASGDPWAALALAATMWAQFAPVRYSFGHRRRGIFLVRLAVAAGHHEVASAVTADLEEGARRSPAASAAAAALLCRGLVEENPDRAFAALARYRETPLRPDLATCCEVAAELLADAADRDEAIALLHEAATIHADIDASGDAARVEATLHTMGAGLPRPRSTRPSFGWGSLTPMETDISRLVAEGYTNPEIGARLDISRRTVDTHLGHVFTKLGLTGRTQLAAELSDRAPQA